HEQAGGLGAALSDEKREIHAARIAGGRAGQVHEVKAVVSPVRARPEDLARGAHGDAPADDQVVEARGVAEAPAPEGLPGGVELGREATPARPAARRAAPEIDR